MYLRTDEREETPALTEAQMERVRLGFRGYLRRKGFRSEFIVNESDDLLARAHAELVIALRKGVEIEDPVGWTIFCAFRQTTRLLAAKRARPSEVSIEGAADLADATAVTPEEQAEDEDRARKIREAVAKLDEEQRRLIALTYFGGLSVREAGRKLGWHSSKVQRCHEAALKTLRRKLPVKSSDELEIDIAIGLMAWLSLDPGAARDLPAGLEALLDKAGEGASGIVGRAQDLAKRLLPAGGGDTAAALSTSGMGRAVGQCLAAVGVVCVAGAGIVATGGVGGGAKPKPEDRPPALSREASAISPEIAADQPTSSTATSTAKASASPLAREPSRRERRRAAQAAKARAQAAEEREAERQWSGTSQAEEDAIAAPEESGASAAVAESGGSEGVTVTPSASSASPAAEAAAQQQFGAFK